MNPSLQNLLALLQETPSLSADDRDAVVRVAKEVGKALTVAEFKLSRIEKEKRTVSILLEETIDELQLKSLTVEQANASLTQALSEIKAAQVQLIQKEKLASLGELTAGIAHEIQNPLNFVNNFSEVSIELIDELTEERKKGNHEDKELEEELLHDLARNLQKITYHGNRASSIVKGMLEHSRTSTGEKQPTDLKALADEYLRLAYHGQRSRNKDFNAQLITDFDPAVGEVDIVPQDIGRVLLNLYNNAFYAVQQRQRLAVTGYEPTVRVCTRMNGNSLQIRVYDNGTGISPEVVKKIFQPFFTTKPTGEGTGLGLSLSYDIVTKGHGGTLTVVSVEGEGTEFAVILPKS